MNVTLVNSSKAMKHEANGEKILSEAFPLALANSSTVIKNFE